MGTEISKTGNNRELERHLVRRMVAGDSDAFEEFSDDYYSPLYRFALRRLDGDRDLTLEIVQSTLCKAIAKLSTFRGEAALMTWLCACCRNEIAAHFRWKERAPRQLDDLEDNSPADVSVTCAPEEGPAESLLRNELAERVHDVLDQLPPHYGRALEWKYLENRPVDEIANQLGMHLKAAESLLTRARQSFRIAYGRRVASEIAGPEQKRSFG